MRISENEVFNDLEKFSEKTDFIRIYVTENLSTQIFKLLTENKKTVDGLLKMAADLGYGTRNICLASYDGMTVVCRMREDTADLEFYHHYSHDPVPITLNKDDERPTADLSKFITPGIPYAFQMVLYFILFVDIEKKELLPKQIFKPKKYLPVKNDTKRNFIVADVNWGFDIEIDTPFSVSGHYRLQRYGEGRKNAKLIYIKPFAKTGYRRQAGKNKIE